MSLFFDFLHEQFCFFIILLSKSWKKNTREKKKKTGDRREKKHTQRFRAQPDTCFNLTEIKLRLRFTMSLTKYNTNSNGTLVWIRLSFSYTHISLLSCCVYGTHDSLSYIRLSYNKSRVYVALIHYTHKEKQEIVHLSRLHTLLLFRFISFRFFALRFSA